MIITLNPPSLSIATRFVRISVSEFGIIGRIGNRRFNFRWGAR